MTISSLTNRKLQTANGVQLTFAYDYLILDADHLILYHSDDLDTPLTGFTVTGVGNQGGGTAIFTVAPTTGTIVLNREVPFSQTFDYITGGKFPADTHERLADLLVMMVQQLSDRMERSLQLPVSSSVGDLTLPEPIADYLLQWNATADGLNNVQLSDLNALITTTPFSESLLDDPDAATARATLNVLSSVEIDSNISSALAFRGCLAVSVGSQSIPNDTSTVITIFTEEDYDTDAIHSNSVNPSRLTVPAGVTRVRISSAIVFDPSTVGYRQAAIRKNGSPSAVNGIGWAQVPASTTTFIQTTTAVITVTEDDYFEIRVRQDSGGALDSSGWFSMEIIE